MFVAFLAVLEWNSSDTTSNLIIEEAASLREIIRNAKAFDDTTRDTIKTAVYKYVVSIIENEFKELSHTGRASIHTKAAFRDLVDAVHNINAQTPLDIMYMDQLTDNLSYAGLKRSKIVNVAGNDIPTEFWIIIIPAAVVSLLYTYVLQSTSRIMRIISIFVNTAFLFSVLVLIMYLQYPFTGSISVKLDAYITLRDDITHDVI